MIKRRKRAVEFAVVLLILLRLYLPDGRQSWRRPVSQFLAAAILFFGGYSLIQGEASLYDLWASTWLIAPSTVTLYWLSSGLSGTWSSGSSDERIAELGLAHNKRVGPTIETWTSIGRDYRALPRPRSRRSLCADAGGYQKTRQELESLRVDR